MFLYKLRHKFINLKIQNKISLTMISLLVFLIVFIYITIVASLQTVILSDSLRRMRSSHEAREQSLISSYANYMFQFNSLVSDTSFQNILLNVSKQDKSTTEHRLLLQDTISTLTTANPAVKTVYFIDNYKNAYYSYETFYNNESDLFFFQPKDISGITILPQRKSPFFTNDQVIPVIIPLTLRYIDQSQFTLIADSSENAMLYVTILISASSLNDLIQLWSNEFKSSHLFFIDRNGNLLSSPNSNILLSNNYDIELKNEKFLTPLFESNTIEQSKLSDSYVTSKALTSNLALVSISTRDEIFTMFSDLKNYMLFALIIGLLFTAAMTVLLSIFVSEPIAKLAVIVHKIKTNSYTEITLPDSTDEVGELNNAINDMYLTIQEQINQIKDSERQKFQTEIKLLSEQINPHLLYNTLEFINMEIYNNNTDVASNMVQALADYMRISLSYGSDKIFIQDETAHVRAYLKMMNYRFHNNIILLTSVSEDLKYCYITKSILQPFVENSIKHGFTMGTDASQIFNPTIEIAFKFLDGQLHINICDNGLGFNVDEMYALLQKPTNEESKKHVGLRNVIQRLEASYSNVTMTLSSTPYFKNEIILHFPYQLDDQKTEVIV